MEKSSKLSIGNLAFDTLSVDPQLHDLEEGMQSIWASSSLHRPYLACWISAHDGVL